MYYKNEAPAKRGPWLHCSDYDATSMLSVMELLCLNNAINRANFHTLALVEVTFALNAFFGVDFENHIAFVNRFSGANRFTGSARNAII
jgi:hypothetical protein